MIVLEEENKLLKEKVTSLEIENEKLKKKDLFMERFVVHKEKKKIKKLCGFEIDEFLGIRDKIEIEMNSKTVKNNKRKNESYKKGRFDNEMMIFITLLWLKHYPKNSLLSFFLGVSNSLINSIIKKL